ncbi:hypothetical protein C8N24_6499 [Solirubrobacter pauli]|uniref:Uncharacterized protein n=1 Tax=Solirubrobacter pauli TaxID=166793 RepID=A0A660KXZ2_9ACTN|nr:hypothetical protein [Solirubrobacter pauli]RKQ84869.1 hypothetical protein C8N24_6499 [Solirubrobacter pauli]
MIWPTRFLLPLLAVAIPVQVWIDRGPLFGLVAAATFPPMFLLTTFAREWLLKPRPPGPRLLALAGPLPILPLAFVTTGWLLDLSPKAALLVGVALYLPLALLGAIRHPGPQGPALVNGCRSVDLIFLANEPPWIAAELERG